MSAAARFLRQVLLAEIGPEGQRRIEAGVARVAGDPASLAHEIAGLYARGAGFPAVAGCSIDVAALAPEPLVAAKSAREVLAGSRAALAEIRRAIMEKGG